MQQHGLITIEKPYGGMTQSYGTNPRAFEGQPGEYSQGTSITLASLSLEGCLAPGYFFDTVTDNSTVVDGLPLNAVVDSNAVAYVVMDNGKLLFFSTLGSSISAGNKISPPNSLTSDNNNDVAIYNFQSGSGAGNTTDQYIFWSWDSSTSSVADVGICKVSSTVTANANYLSGLVGQSNGTFLIKSVPHPLLVGKDQNLYVGNGQYLAKHDPTTTTVDYQAFKLQPNWVVQAMTTYQNYIAIVAYKPSVYSLGNASADAKLFLWDGFSPTWNFEYPLRDYFVGAVLNDSENLYVWTYGRSNTTKYKQFNGRGFDTIYEGLAARMGSAPLRGAVDILWGHRIWGTVDNRLCAYGSAKRGYPEGFHLWDASSLNPIGMAKNLAGNSLYIGQNNGGNTYSLKVINTSKYAITGPPNWTSSLYSLPTNSTIQAIKIYFAQFGSGASITVGLFKDFNATNIGGANDLINTTISNTAYGNVTYAAISKTVDNVNSFCIKVHFDHANPTDTAAIIRKIDIVYSYDEENI